MLKFPTIIVILLNSPLMAVCACLTCQGAPALGAYTFTTVISSLGLIP